MLAERVKEMLQYQSEDGYMEAISLIREQDALIRRLLRAMTDSETHARYGTTAYLYGIDKAILDAQAAGYGEG